MQVMTENKVVPSLRFRDFEREWIQSTLGNELNYTKGVAFKSNDYTDNGVRIVRVSDLLSSSIKTNNEKVFISKDDEYKYLKYKIQKGNIIITTVGSHPDLIESAVGRGIYILHNDEGLLNQNMLKLENNNTVNNKFIHSIINSPRYIHYIKAIKRGNANQANITVKELLQYTISLPPLPEQQKIAAFLSAVDKKLQQLTKKKGLLEEYKKGVMQKIFSQALRFKDDNGNNFPDWEEKKLGEELEHKSIRNKSNQVDLVLSVSNKKGFISQQEQFDGHQVASKDVTNYKVVNKGEYAYNPSRINVGSIARLDDFEKGIVSPMYVIFRLKNNLNPIFFDALYSSHRFKYLIKIGSSGSVRDSLNFDELEKFDIKLPCIEEQQKIANFLSSLDSKIALVSTQIENTKAFKKGLLQQMFV